jgi:hypothetical protein
MGSEKAQSRHFSDRRHQIAKALQCGFLDHAVNAGRYPSRSTMRVLTHLDDIRASLSDACQGLSLRRYVGGASSRLIHPNLSQIWKALASAACGMDMSAAWIFRSQKAADLGSFRLMRLPICIDGFPRSGNSERSIGIVPTDDLPLQPVDSCDERSNQSVGLR